MSDTEVEKQRLLELLSDRALFGLAADEERELSELQSLHPDVDDNEIDRIVALLESSRPQDPMPSDVRKDVLRKSEPFQPSSPASSKRSLQRDWLIAIVASAATLLASVLYFGSEDSVVARRASLQRTAADLTEVAWTDPAAKITGDVVWSTDRQEGYMLFRGLPINDPTKEQYQLWILDGEQKHPIDGGVFDIPSSGEVVVPIDAKIRVRKPAGFAVTIEEPGGVVVSDQNRVPVSAILPKPSDQ